MVPNQPSMPNPCNPVITCAGALRQNSAFRPMASNCVAKSPDRENATSLPLNIFGQPEVLPEYRVLPQTPSRLHTQQPLKVPHPHPHPHLLKVPHPHPFREAKRAESRYHRVATIRVHTLNHLHTYLRIHSRLHTHMSIHRCPGNRQPMNGTLAYQKPVTRSALMVQRVRKWKR